MTPFSIDPKLARETHAVAGLGLSDLRLMDDARFPWLILVPRRAGAVELIDLTPADQRLLTDEIAAASRALRGVTRCDKLNIGALGNIVRQLHVHVVARFTGDAAWPGPVWDHGTGESYQGAARAALMTKLRGALRQ